MRCRLLDETLEMLQADPAFCHGAADGLPADGNPKIKEVPHNGEALEQQTKARRNGRGLLWCRGIQLNNVAIKAELFHMDNCFYRYSGNPDVLAKPSFPLRHPQLKVLYRSKLNWKLFNFTSDVNSCRDCPHSTSNSEWKTNSGRC